MKGLGAFTVIVPTYNRLSSLEMCIRGIAALEYPSDQMQVIVVNDGGIEIPAAVKQAGSKSLDLSVITQPNSGPSVARNRGVECAKHEWIAFIDDDCVPARDWLTQLASGLAADGSAVVGGKTINGLRENIYAEASQTLILFLLEYYHHSHDTPSQVAFFPANNFAIARATFQQAGGFNPTMRYGEERDLALRLAALGCAFRYVPAAQVVHARPMNFVSFWRQHQAYGKGAYQYQTRRAQTTRRGLRLEPLHFYSRMLAFPLRGDLPRATRVAALVAVSQVANFVGFLSAALAARFGSRQ